MRLPFLSMFITSPFEGLQEHAEKVKECAWAFQQAMECYVSKQCQTFEEFRQEVKRLENEADAIKRRIRGHLPKGSYMPVEKYHFFRYLREQDYVLDSVKETVDWLSFRTDPGVPEPLIKLINLLTDAVIDPIEELTEMVAEARKYFKTFSEKQRKRVKDIIHRLRVQEHEADKVEYQLKQTIFNNNFDPVTHMHMITLAKLMGEIADHAENAGDMMRAMLAK